MSGRRDEVLAGTIFRALVGKEAAKYKVVTGQREDLVAVDSFTHAPFKGAATKWVRSTEIPRFFTFSAKSIPALELPGLARVLLIGGLIGETDWNPGNFGRAVVTGSPACVRRIDFGMSFNFHVLPVSKLTSRDGLVSLVQDGSVSTWHVSQKEFAETLAMLRSSGEQSIRVAGEPLEGMLDEYRDLPGAALEIGQHGYFVEQIVDRLHELLALTSDTKS